MVPEPANRLADGVLVEAQVRARLFGAPVLRVDAEVVLSPARAEHRSPPTGSPTPVVRQPDPVPAPGAASARPGAALAHAVALAGEGAETLRGVGAAARRDQL